MMNNNYIELKKLVNLTSQELTRLTDIAKKYIEKTENWIGETIYVSTYPGCGRYSAWIESVVESIIEKYIGRKRQEVLNTLEKSDTEFVKVKFASMTTQYFNDDELDELLSSSNVEISADCIWIDSTKTFMI